MSHIVNLTFDVDLHLLWTGTHKRTQIGEMSRGEFGLSVGLPRILSLLDDEKIKATFFIPGKVAEIYPDTVREIHELGHEIAVHGYAHERWNELDYKTELELVQKSTDIIEQIIKEKVDGFRSPAWSLNSWSVKILNQLNFKYDSSLMADDYTPYYLREGDNMDLDGNIYLGKKTNLLEFPVAWELDDFPYFCFTGRQSGLRLPSEVLAYWKEEYDCSTEYGRYFILTMHPQIIGRAPRVEMLREFIHYIKTDTEVTFNSLKENITMGVI
jgi:peptidoglycan-N-acetylglucosamine deacetylase